MVYADSVKLKTMLVRYIEEVAGVVPTLRPAGRDVTARVPLFLRTAYDLLEARVFDQEVLFALPKKAAQESSPSELDGHVSRLAQTTGRHTAVVLPSAPSYTRNRLVKRRVPFVVPGRQMFLPMLMVDLRERFAPRARATQDALTGPGQLVVLSHLHGKEIEHVPLGDLAAALGYSAMTLSKVAEELVAHGLCDLVRRGRTRRLRPTLPREQLWQQAQPLLQSPIKAKHWVRWADPPVEAWIAGATALSAHTLLDDSDLPTYAMRTEDYRRALRKGELSERADADDASAGVERWRYSPAVLAEGNTVDRLSLCLSLRDSADERVQQALERMMETFPW